MVDRFSLPVWIREGAEVKKLASAFGEYWDKVEGWVKTPLNQLDAENCHVYVLKLMAYQRDIDRFANEPDDIFRKRVKFAVKNAIDAGSQEGFKSIFERFDVPLYGQIEREDGVDWDVITLWLADSTITQNPELGQYIIRQYGRTCRRYAFLIVDGLEGLEVGARATTLDKQLNVLEQRPDWVFEDETDSLQSFAATNVLERHTNRVEPLPLYVFGDEVEGMHMTFFGSSVEIYNDILKSNEG
ncbi:hypothetical protein V6238_01690 [Marinomonas arenicola]|uniref:hypothetical protein n=1 Tax=Marinomonas arenicola TaxID=569601 RepID=UPI00311F776D